VTTEEIARHEAGHYAMGLTVGLPVRTVALTDNGTAGYVAYDRCSHTTHGCVMRIMTVLGGLIETAPPDGLPAWPLDPNDGPDEEREDRYLLKSLVDRLDLTHSDYRTLVIAALRLSASSDYQRLVTAISGTLDYTPIIDRDLLTRVEAIAERKRPWPT
jgi:hypothetical protein